MRLNNWKTALFRQLLPDHKKIPVPYFDFIGKLLMRSNKEKDAMPRTSTNVFDSMDKALIYASKEGHVNSK